MVFGLWPTNTQGNKNKCWLSRPRELTQTTKTKHTIPAAASAGQSRPDKPQVMGSRTLLFDHIEEA